MRAHGSENEYEDKHKFYNFNDDINTMMRRRKRRSMIMMIR